MRNFAENLLLFFRREPRVEGENRRLSRRVVAGEPYPFEEFSGFENIAFRRHEHEHVAASAFREFDDGVDERRLEGVFVVVIARFSVRFEEFVRALARLFAPFFEFVDGTIGAGPLASAKCSAKRFALIVADVIISLRSRRRRRTRFSIPRRKSILSERS